MFRGRDLGRLGNYVLVELYTDGSDEASQLNQQLEESKFKTIAIPFTPFWTRTKT